MYGFAADYMEFASYAAGTVKTVPYIDAGESAERTLQPGVWLVLRIRPLSHLRCQCIKV